MLENRAGVAGQPEHICQLAKAGRGWSAEAGGRPELDLALMGRSKAGGELAVASGRLVST
eukprot:scaffold90287_cov45-Phaeocystis_antarctica.AAC.1